MKTREEMTLLMEGYEASGQMQKLFFYQMFDYYNFF